MALIRRSAAGLAELAANGSIAETLLQQLLYTAGHGASPGEVRSWDRSLSVLADDVRSAGLHDVELLIEHQLPLTSQRVDAILAGDHPRTGAPSYVVIELKQWSSAVAYEDDANLALVEAYGSRPVENPLRQVQRYCDYLLDFVPVLRESEAQLVGAAYLHNATDSSVESIRLPPTSRGRLFTGQNRGGFHDFLREHLAPDSDGAAAGDLLLHAHIAPSRQLLAVAADEIQRREQFLLIGNQQLAYDLVLHETRKARQADHKTVVVITGGPGTGKSVVALSLLGELAREGVPVLHATGSRSFTQTLRKVAGARSVRTQELFKYFNSFMAAEKNGLSVLILDEAHRIRETSANRWTKASERSGRRQIEELIAAARVPVFLLDEHQVVRPGEMGTVDEIRAEAEGRGLDVVEVNLGEQFRCGGSATYERWVLRLLGLENGGPVSWVPDGRYHVEVSESPQAMEDRLRAHLADGDGARMAAGYCWPWSDPRKDGSLVPDVSIAGWSRPWNLKGERAVGGAPPASLWASDPAGFEQVGCVYTAQGFEYDWSGVIFGPDLVWRDGNWVSLRAANRDPDFRSTKRVTDDEFRRLALNVYKVLLTRGMKGTYVFSTDAETQDFLRRQTS